MTKQDYSMPYLNLLLWLGLIGMSFVPLQAQTIDSLFEAQADSFIYLEDWDALIEFCNMKITQQGEKEPYIRSRGFAFIQKNDLEQGEKDYKKALQLNDQCYNCYVNLAKIAKQRKDETAFDNYLDQAIAIDRSNPHAFFLRADDAMNKGGFQEAIKDFTKVINLVEDARSLLMRSLCYMEIGNLEGAYQDVNRSIELKADVEYAYFVRAQLLVQVRQYAGAIADLDICIKKNPAYLDYYVYRAYALFSIGENKKAIDDYNKTIEMAPDNYHYYWNRSYAYANALNFGAACKDKQTALEMAVADPETHAKIKAECHYYCDDSKPTFYYNQIELAIQGQSFGIASTLVQKALEKYPSNSVLHHYNASIDVMQGKFDQALVDLKLAQKSLKKLKDESDFAEQRGNSVEEFATIYEATIYDSYAYCYANLNNFKEAVKQIDKSIKGLEKGSSTEQIKRIKAQAYSKKSMFYVAQLKPEPAKDALYAAMIADVENSQLYSALANILILEATKVFEKADKKNVETRNASTLSDLYSTVDHEKEEADPTKLTAALEKCDQAINLNQYNVDAYYYRARAKILLGREDYCEDAQIAYQLGKENVLELLGVDCQ